MLDIDTYGRTASRTFVMPNPGGKIRSEISHIDTEETSFLCISDEVLEGNNSLLRVANPLLNIIYQVRTLVHNQDPSQLRNYLIDEIKRFDKRAKMEGIPAEKVAAAKYCLCTVIDETAAQTPWGGGGVWAKYSLLVTFYSETWGGEKFFQILSRVTQEPAAHSDLIELMYFCISLGFEGRYKVVPNGQSQLELLRRRLSEIITDVNGEIEKSISPHWQGIVRPRLPIWTILPVWVSALFCSILLALLFVAFSIKLSDMSDPVFARIMAIPTPSVNEVGPLTQIEGQISQLLQEEISNGLVTVKESGGVAIVTLMGDGLFPSSSSTLNPAYNSVIKKIALAVTNYGKGVVISGHTDNVPIRSPRFPSNWHLSVERARAVASYFDPTHRLNGNLKVQGLGESEPIASNTTVEGRALNRRVEVKILLTAVR